MWVRSESAFCATFWLIFLTSEPSGGEQLAFEERSNDGAEEADELRQLSHQVDLLLLEAAGVAAWFAAKPYYDGMPAQPMRVWETIQASRRP